jgi:hypothetical protein
MLVSDRNGILHNVSNPDRASAIACGVIVPNAALGDAIVAFRSHMHAPSVGPSRQLPWYRNVPTLTLDRIGTEAAKRTIAGEDTAEDDSAIDVAAE